MTVIVFGIPFGWSWSVDDPYRFGRKELW